MTYRVGTRVIVTDPVLGNKESGIIREVEIPWGFIVGMDCGGTRFVARAFAEYVGKATEEEILTHANAETRALWSQLYGTQ